MMDLQQFCSNREHHFHHGINVPFSKGDWTYATDGVVCIRVPRLVDVINEKGPNAEKLFMDANERGEAVWQPLPPFDLKVEKCEWCDGKGYMKVCPAWDDEDIKCTNGDGKHCREYNDDCQKPCNQSDDGATACEECEGKGTIELQGNIIVDGSKSKVRISAIYLQKIKDLPNVQIAPYESESMLLLKFDGGEGLLMPMRP